MTKSYKKCGRGHIEDGAENGSRTRDLRITSASLYQLSYLGIEEVLDKGLGVGGVKGNGLCGGSYLDRFQKILRLWVCRPAANDMIKALCFFIPPKKTLSHGAVKK